MTRRPQLRTDAPRGSSLVMAVIVIGVLAAIGSASVLLSSRDRINAGAKSKRDALAACASAAAGQIWAEFGKTGAQWLQGGAGVELTLPDGTRLGAFHYDQPASTPVSEVALSVRESTDDYVVRDLTNRAGGLLGATLAHRIVARCTIPGRGLFTKDRQVEVELTLRTKM